MGAEVSDKLTPWYPPHIKPVRKGVYETHVPAWGYNVGLFSYWDGSRWGFLEDSPEDAYKHRKPTWGNQFKSWRGLARPPKGKA